MNGIGTVCSNGPEVVMCALFEGICFLFFYEQKTVINLIYKDGFDGDIVGGKIASGKKIVVW